MGKMKIKKLGSIKSAKSAINKSGGGGNFAKSIPADGIVVRFLEEPDQWYEIQQYWDAGDNRFYIVTEDTDMSEVKQTSVRYVTNVVDVDENEVVAIVLPKTVAQKLMDRYDKYHTVTDRDYELSKSGTGKNDTRYNVDPEPASKKNLDRYELLDLMAILEAMVPDSDSDDDDDEDDTPRRSKSKSKSKSRRDEDDDDLDDDDDDDEEEAPRRSKSKSRRKPVVDDDDDDDEEETPRRSRSKSRRKPVDDDDDDDDEEETPRRKPRRRR